MKTVKLVLVDGTKISFETDATEDIRGRLLDKDRDKLAIHFDDKTIWINLNNVSFMEVEN